MIQRYLVCGFLTFASLLISACADEGNAGDEAEVMSALNTFLRAFENGNLALMEDLFADDAVTFPRVVMSDAITGPIDSSNYRRINGLDPQMGELIERWREMNPGGPPYQNFDPQDLEVNLFTDAALVTFHLENGNNVSRRTFVLANRDGAWKVVHIHASNVDGSD